MGDYILRRIVLLIPTFFLASLVVFGLIRFIPGSAMDIFLREQGVANRGDVRSVEFLKHQLGFDKPIHVQYWDFISNALRGNLGTSFWTKEAIAPEILERLPVTVTLGMMAIFFALVFGIPVGVLAAIRQDSWPDYITRSFAIALLALPGFWIGTLVIVFPSIWWGIIPPVFHVRFSEDPLRNLSQFLLPALILGSHSAATVMRMTRSMMLEVLRQDYIRTAWSKGLREGAVIYRHALKNALIPVVTILGLQFSFLLGGSVIMESIFSLPGIGLLMIESIRSRDYPAIQAVNLFVVTWVILVNLAVDVSYGYLDPRIRYR